MYGDVIYHGGSTGWIARGSRHRVDDRVTGSTGDYRLLSIRILRVAAVSDGWAAASLLAGENLRVPRFHGRTLIGRDCSSGYAALPISTPGYPQMMEKMAGLAGLFSGLAFTTKIYGRNSLPVWPGWHILRFIAPQKSRPVSALALHRF